jgi:DNA-binding MarR family transcriptional regulator
MSRIVRGLEQVGLARRLTHVGDRRATVVEATSEGERVLQEARARRIERISAALVELDAAELEGVGRAAESVERLFGSRERPWRPLRRS